MSNIFERNQMNGGNKVVYAILAILLIAGMGVGGYYLGWFLDKQAAAKQALTNSQNTQTINDSTLGIKFSYPGSWTKSNKTTKDGATVVSIENNSGSIFAYSESADAGILSICNQDTPNGNSKETKKCTFVSGQLSFARFQDSTDSELWRVAEKGAATNTKAYVNNTGKGFYYIVKSVSDLTELDNIMKSVVRTK